MKLIKENVLPVILNALREDVGTGDLTSTLVFEKDVNVMADIIVNEECVISGLDVAKWTLNAVDENIVFRPLCKDGDTVRKGKKIVSLKGWVKNILTSERTVLNFLARLSGISTLTNNFVKKVKATPVKIFDTRKTSAGLRELERYAVRIGGGVNHRAGLWDGILIKDNHLIGSLAMVKDSRENIIKDAVRKAKRRGYKNVEIEIDNLKEYKWALDSGADIIMLDNMKIEDIKKAVKLRGKESVPLLEVSGGVTLENVRSIANTGVDRISIGSLTHSAPSIDFSLEICR